MMEETIFLRATRVIIIQTKPKLGSKKLEAAAGAQESLLGWRRSSTLHACPEVLVQPFWNSQ
jgi:hypothetical protein